MEKCSICGSESRVFPNKLYGKMLCQKHRLQYQRHGKFFKGDRYGKNRYEFKGDEVSIFIEDYKTGKLLGIAKIDKSDFEKVINYKWDIQQGYARNRKVGRMHRFLLNPNEEQVIDHINENRLDNRRSNLRVTNKSVNAYNISKARVDSKTGVRGVTKHRDKYRATIRVEGKQTHVGTFDTLEQAKEAYEARKREVMT